MLNLIMICTGCLSKCRELYPVFAVFDTWILKRYKSNKSFYFDKGLEIASLITLKLGIVGKCLIKFRDLLSSRNRTNAYYIRSTLISDLVINILIYGGIALPWTYELFVSYNTSRSNITKFHSNDFRIWHPKINSCFTHISTTCSKSS